MVEYLRRAVVTVLAVVMVLLVGLTLWAIATVLR